MTSMIWSLRILGRFIYILFYICVLFNSLTVKHVCGLPASQQFDLEFDVIKSQKLGNTNAAQSTLQESLSESSLKLHLHNTYDGSNVDHDVAAKVKQHAVISADHLQVTANNGNIDMTTSGDGLLLGNVSSTLSANLTECRHVHKLPSEDQCAFVKTSDDCDIDNGLINYTRFIYCTLGPRLVPLSVTILLLWMFILFVSLATTADDFFCPSLQVISKTLRLSDNIAGVTLLAFGNGAPDVFSSIAAIKTMKNGDTGVAMGALLGAGMFITTVIAGSIAVIHPFKSMERPFLRDVIFYIVAVFLVFVVFYTGRMTLAWALVFIGIYLLYVAVVVIGRCIYKYQKRSRRRQPARVVYDNAEDDDDDPLIGSPNTSLNDDRRPHGRGDSDSEHDSVRGNDDSDDDDDSILHSRDDGDINSMTVMQRLKRILRGMMNTVIDAYNTPTFCSEPRNDPFLSSDNEDDDDTEDDAPLLDPSHPSEPAASPWRKLLDGINPIDLDDWQQAKWYWKIYQIIKSAPLFLFLVTVPLVDYSAPQHNWNRYLILLQCVTAPSFVTLAVAHADAWNMKANYAPVIVEVAICGAAVAIFAHRFSKDHRPPRWHWIAAYVGFIVALFWIQAIASEIVNLLNMFGIVFNISSALLGLTVLAWGNSIGDFIADIAMTRQGFPRTGISACFGGPLFNLLMGLGIPFTIHCSDSGPIDVQLSLLQLVLIIGVLASLVSSLVIIPLNRFYFSRGYGCYLYLLYLTFIVIAVLAESGILPDTLQY